jgi:hypothetical protein
VRPRNMRRTMAGGITLLAISLAACSTVADTGTSSATTVVSATSTPSVDARDRATATWYLAPSQSLDSGAMRFTALVSRLGCNSGVTGTVNPPEVRMTADKFVITFTVSPGPPQSVNCQGNTGVPYLVELPEPLGARALVDGACDAAEAGRTAFCESGGVRRSP